MPRFPIARSTRTPGFISTPQPTQIEGANELRLIGQAVEGIGRGVSTGLQRFEQRRQKMKANQADIKLTEWEIAKEQKLRELNEKYYESTDQAGYEAEYTQAMQDLDSEYFSELDEDQLNRIQVSRLKANATADEVMAGYSSGIGLNAKVAPIENRFAASVANIRQNPGLLEDRLGRMESYLAESDDGSMAHKVAVEKFNSKMKPIMIETAVQTAVNNMDINSLKDIENKLERGFYDLDPDEANKMLADVRRGIQNTGTNHRSIIVSESQHAVRMSEDPFKTPTWTPPKSWDAALSTASNDSERNRIERARANEVQAKEVWEYSRELWSASSTDREAMKREIRDELSRVSLSDRLNEEKSRDYETLNLKVQAIQRQEEFIREDPYSAMELSNPALRDMQANAFASGDQAAVSEYFEAAAEEQYRNSAFMDNPPEFKLLGPLLSGQFSEQIKSGSSLKEQSTIAKSIYDQFDSAYAISARKEIQGDDEQLQRAFVASAVKPGLLDAYEKSLAFRDNKQKIFSDTKTENNTALAQARKETADAIGTVVNLTSKDYGLMDQMATDATVAALADPSLQAGDQNAGDLYKSYFDMAMGDNTINGTILVPPKVKAAYPALAVQDNYYGKPIRKQYAFNKNLVDYIEKNGGMVMPTDYIGGSWKDLLLSEDGETPTAIEFRWNGSIGKYGMYLEGSNYAINTAGRPLGLTPEEYHGRPDPMRDIVPMSDYELIGGAFIAVGKAAFGMVNKESTPESEWIKRTLEPMND